MIEDLKDKKYTKADLMALKSMKIVKNPFKMLTDRKSVV